MTERCVCGCRRWDHVQLAGSAKSPIDPCRFCKSCGYYEPDDGRET